MSEYQVTPPSPEVIAQTAKTTLDQLKREERPDTDANWQLSWITHQRLQMSVNDLETVIPGLCDAIMDIVRFSYMLGKSHGRKGNVK